MTDYERVERVIRYIDARYEEQPSLSELAEVAQVSEFHFHRLFSRWAGITPKGFLKSVTAAHAKALLGESRSVLGAALSAGLSGPGRLHDLLVSVDGVTPGELKARGAGLEIRYGVHPSPFGACLLAATERGVCHLSFLEGSKASAVASLRSEWANARLAHDPRSTGRLAARIFGSLSRAGGPIRAFLVGTPFQLKVWEALVRIPPGKVTSYGDVARSIGMAGSSRAIGTAAGSNRVAFLIPCHRVIRETGVFGQYRWGGARKRAILAWEGGAARRLTAPRFAAAS